MFEMGEGRGNVPEHQNEPTGAPSAVRDGEGTMPE